MTRLKLLIAAAISISLAACVATVNDDYSTDVFSQIDDRANGGGQ